MMIGPAGGDVVSGGGAVVEVVAVVGAPPATVVVVVVVGAAVVVVELPPQAAATKARASNKSNSLIWSKHPVLLMRSEVRSRTADTIRIETTLSRPQTGSVAGHDGIPPDRVLDTMTATGPGTEG